MFVQLIASGIAHGALYSLVALGMTVIFKATTVVNFGHGDLVMAGAYAAYVLAVSFGVPIYVSIFLGIALIAVLGYIIQRGFIQPILSGPHLSIAMMAIAAGYTLRGVARLFSGTQILTYPRIYPNSIYTVDSVVLSTGDIVVTLVAVLLLIVLAIAFFATPLGKLAQAVFQSAHGAALIGVNVNRFYGAMWGLGAALAAIGGILLAPRTLLYPDMSAWVLIRGFAAMALGGFGSLSGAVVGGLLLGVVELLLGIYVSTNFIEITAYLVIVAVLLVKPTGLFGQKEMVRV
ncbi:MAG: branched-chain amino acid ABC transporter permease [Candidimonas sp.]|nr:MAG: branched-chain amino acid ABC transporter permease [Candidimonas sp.]